MESRYDRQKQRTDEFILKALFECLEKTSWQQLSVTMLCQQAQIGRKTFYRHFSSIHNVLEYWFVLRSEEYIRSVSALSGYEIQTIAREFFSFWQNYKEELSILQSASVDYTAFLFRCAADVIGSRMSSIRCANESDPAYAGEYFILYSAGGFIALLENWITHHPDLDALEYANAAAAQIQRVVLQQSASC